MNDRDYRKGYPTVSENQARSLPKMNLGVIAIAVRDQLRCRKIPAPWAYLHQVIERMDAEAPFPRFCRSHLGPAKMEAIVNSVIERMTK